MPSECPPRPALVGFHLGTLPAEEVDAVAAHVETCTGCEAELQRLDAATDSLIAGLRAPPTRPPTDSPELPGYEIVAPIGRGGMGVVYEARQTSLNRSVALKRLPAGRASARARAEAEALGRLRHPNIVQIHEVAEHAGALYLVLELIPGGSLAGRLRGRPQPPAAAAELVRTVARAVHFAHATHIVHRDLKPSNILLDPRDAGPTRYGVPKVADFGIAKHLTADTSETRDGDILGTPGYMAPEQASGKLDETGPAADVYALGAILYEMLTGRVPLQGTTPLETLELLRHEEPVPPRQLQPGVPRDLETICVKCLQKDPGRRYSDAEALAADLDAFLAGRPITARPVGAVERAVKLARRHPGRTVAIAATAMVVLGAAVAADTVRSQRAADRVAAEERRLNDLRAADLAAADRERAARAADLIDALATAQTPVVSRIIADLAPVRDHARAKVRDLAAQPIGTKPGLHGRMAALAIDAGPAAELADYLPTCRPDEVGPLRDLLRPRSAEVAPRLWAILADAGADPGGRLRAACALARLTPDDPRWKGVAPAVADVLVGEYSLGAAAWADALAPVRAALIPELMTRYPAARQRLRSGKLGESEFAAEVSGLDRTAGLLARYTADRPSDLAELTMTVEARHHPPFARAIVAHRGAVVPLLRAELGKTAAGPAAEALAVRQANAAAVLLALDEADALWPVLKHSPDPTARSHLVHRLAAVGTDPAALVRRFRAGPDVSVRRAILLALGEFPLTALPAGDREALTTELLSVYRDHPDPGLHAATDWLLRQKWGRTEDLTRIDGELARRTNHPDPTDGVKDWFVNTRRQTFAVVRGPVEFVMGSPPTEPGRPTASEDLHTKRIDRSFAIAAREVTVAELLQAVPDHEWGKDYSPGPDTPAVKVGWYRAAAYCNWLSGVNGIPEDQWCYEPIDKGNYTEGMRIKPGHLALAGYRLPTEAEWEYAARAGAATARHFGRSDELLSHYAWWMKNSDDRARPVGRLKPNDLGLFDMLGNALEWVEDPAVRYDPEARLDQENTNFLIVTERRSRVQRGGSFLYQPAALRSAARFPHYPGLNVNNSMGFRPARTILPGR
jgi:formylglycine-generating enzyme required for sulfatase activity/tRNA A-37 threonylcarbamoyl transferase component Bud32